MKQPIIAEEIHLPTNTRSRLASHIWMALEFANKFTDLIIIEGSPIYVKSVSGTVELQHLIGTLQSFIVTINDIKAFFAQHVSNQSTRENPDAYWATEVAPILSARNSISRSVRTPRASYLRFALYQVQGGKVSMSVRVTPPPRAIGDSALPNELIDRITAGDRGLLVITGPTASGKTATALSLLEHLNQTSSAHIVSVEDPIEYPMQPNRCVFSQREVGIDVNSFGQGLREALRMSPDVLLVGEVRDAETAETAILAGESGALVIVTTHGQSPHGALSKLVSLVGDSKSRAMRSVLAGSLLGVLRQELLPTTDQASYALVSDYLRSTPNIKGMIERGEWDRITDILSSDLRSPDHVSMNSVLITMVKRGTVTAEQALLHSSNRIGLRDKLPR